MYLELKSKYQDLGIGTYYHCSDNTHYYERHFSLVEKLRLEDVNPENEIELRMTRPIFDSSESGMSKSAIEFVDYMEQVNDFSVFNTYDYIDIFHKFFVEE
jgi:thymidylate synthase